jgi:hypothetical protein
MHLSVLILLQPNLLPWSLRPTSDDVLFAIGLSGDEFEEEARFLLSSKLYELGQLTSEPAAQPCDRGRVSFLLSLPRVGVSISNLRAETRNPS